MDPLDALVLKAMKGSGGRLDGAKRDAVTAQLHASRDAIDVSVLHLGKLDLTTGSAGYVALTPVRSRVPSRSQTVNYDVRPLHPQERTDRLCVCFPTALGRC
jgi:hypothetical protein